MEEARSFGPLLIVVTLAFVVPLLLSTLRGALFCSIPIVVGEIVAGIIVGRSGFAWVLPDNSELILLKELGFVFLMFLSGMEIDVRAVRGTSSRRGSEWSPFSVALLNFAATLAVAGAFAWVLTSVGVTSNPWLMTLILSTTALGVVSADSQGDRAEPKSLRSDGLVRHRGRRFRHDVYDQRAGRVYCARAHR